MEIAERDCTRICLRGYCREWRRWCTHVRSAAGISKRRSYDFTEAGSGRDREEMPLALDGLQLMHAAVFGMEEILSVGNSLCARRTQRTFLPTHGAQSPAVLALFPLGVNAVVHLVLNTGGAGRHQPPAAFDLLLAHDSVRCKRQAKRCRTRGCIKINRFASRG